MRLISLFWILALNTPAAWATVRYVKATATGSNNGSSWSNAYTNLQTAITTAQSGDEIWVAAGTYKPTSGTDRTKSFIMKIGVGIYGGFAGNETARVQRNLISTTTTLSGDIGVAGNISDNSFHVITGGNNAVLDGFTITSGNAPYGSGIGANGNSGGGMINDSVFLTIANCTFSGNLASSGYGGGMFNNGGSPTVTNCTFSGNTAGGNPASTGSYGGGGGMYNSGNTTPTVTNCTFVYNSASSTNGGYGGGMYIYNNSANSSGSPRVTNCILWNNSATRGSEIYEVSSKPTFRHCDIRGSGGSGALWNPALGIDGGGNIMADPLFVDAIDADGLDGISRTGDDGLCLLKSSPCIDAGLATGAPGFDILGNPRVSSPDIGAYEYVKPKNGVKWWKLLE